jgi:soluble lytic murein transglycosylase
MRSRVVLLSRTFYALVVLLFSIQPLLVTAQTNLPELTFPDAETALLYGDYDAAIALYTQNAADEALKCDALYGLGVAHFRAEDFPQSETALNDFFAGCDPTFRAYVMRGEVLQAQDKAQEALADYQAALTLNSGVLDSYLYERMALLDPDLGVQYLRLATEAERQPEGKFTLREKLADVYLLVGNETLALAEYDTILAEIDAYLALIAAVPGATFDRDGSLRARINVAAAEIEVQSGEPEAGFARFQNVIANYPETPSAFGALITLVTSAQPVDVLVRSRINVFNENYDPVVGLLSGYLASAPDAPAELYLLLGISQRGLGDTEGALATFATLQTQFPEDPIAQSLALEIGQTYVEAGDTVQAIAMYIQFVADFPEAPEAPEALLRAADLLRDSGNMARALELYNQLGTAYPDSVQAKGSAFQLGMELMETDPEQAADFLGRVGTAEAYYWQGTLLSDEAAQTAWTNAVAAEPWMFFSMRACERINDTQPFTFSETLDIQPITEADIDAAETWVEQVFGLTEVSAELSPELANDPMLIRGTELWALGLWEEARAEFDIVHKLHRADPAALLQLAFHYPTLPVYRSSLFAAIRLISASGIPVTTIPTALLKLAYPLYYADLLLPMSEQNNLDPLLVASLIRQESSFDATVHSVANARGMMQFIPATAQEVADQLGWTDFKMIDLQRPLVNIPFGTFYLRSMQEAQGGSIPGAILSYNAGPNAAASWLQTADGDFDLLHETIEYEETQIYLESIYDNYAVYHYLYGDDVPACMFEPLAAPAS